MIPSIELIIGLVGSTIGVAICIMFPASCFIKIGKKNSTEKLLAQMILVFGFFLMVLGTYANLIAIDEQSSGPTRIVEEPVLQQIDLPANLTDFINEHRLDGDLKLPKSFVKEIDLLESEVLNSPDPVKAANNIKTAADDANVPEKKIADESSSNLSGANESKKENDINREAILREDQEIAIDAQEQSDVKVDMNRLEKTNNFLLKQVQEFKDNLKKQNQERKNMVLQKIDEIADKIDHIEKEQEEVAAANRVEQKEEYIPKLTENIDSAAFKNQTVELLLDPIDMKATKNNTQPEAKPVNRDNPLINLFIKNQATVNASTIVRVADAKNDTVLGAQPSNDNSPVGVEPLLPHSVDIPETIANIDSEVPKADATDAKAAAPLADTAEKVTPAIPYNEKVGRDLLNLYDKTANTTVRDKRNVADEENCAKTTKKAAIADLETPTVPVTSNQLLEPQISNSVAAESVVDGANVVALARDLKSVEGTDAVNSSDL